MGKDVSIWGKLIGGVAGFALGGPLGALLGGVAGHLMVDKRRGETVGAAQHSDALANRQVAFTVAVIALGAKMAKVDGHVSRDEIRAFREVFRISPSEEEEVGRLFNEAKLESTDFEPYARQIAAMFAYEPTVLEELLGGLFHIAKATGGVNAAELNYLAQVAGIFGFDQPAFERIRVSHVGTEEADPYQVLGVSRSASDAEIKSAYRDLIRKNHPDALMAQGMPQEFIDLANEKMSAINAAYDRIEKERGLR